MRLTRSPAQLVLLVLSASVLAGCSREHQPTPETSPPAAPAVETEAPPVGSIWALALDPGDAWIVADPGGRVLRIEPSGRAVELAEVSSPTDVEVDAAGNVYVAEWHAHRVRRIDARTGAIETVAGSGAAKAAGDGGPATEAGVPEPQALALDGRDGLYVASGHVIRRVDLEDGTITTFAGSGKVGSDGDGGPATEARLWAPHGISVAGDGDLLIAQWTRIRRVDADTGIISTVAGKGTEETSTGDGGPPLEATLMPVHFEIDDRGRIVFCDIAGNSVRMIDGGVVTTVLDGAEHGVEPYDVAFVDDGNLLVADHGGTILHVDLASGTVMSALDAS